MKRSSSVKSNPKKKLLKLDTVDNDTPDYTKLLTTEDVESSDEQTLTTTENPKPAKKEVAQKKSPKTNKDNKTSKKIEGKSKATTGIFFNGI